MIVVKCTSVNGGYVEGTAESAKGLAVERMTMCDTVDVRSGRVDGVVDRVGCCIKEAYGTAIDDVAFVIDSD